MLEIELRPDRLEEEAAHDLVEALAESEDEQVCSVVLLHAASDRLWSGLADPVSWNGADFVAALGKVRPPVVVSLRGLVANEGLELALAADLRIASPRTRFRMDGERVPRFGGTQRLPRVVGTERALRMLLLREVLSARGAESLGLVTSISTRPLATARKLARSMAARGPVALRFAKEAVRRARDFTLDDGARFEHDLYSLLQTTADRTEGIQAFLGKRPPRFRGR